MSVGSPVRALAWKEARELRWILAASLVGLVLLSLAVDDWNPQGWAFLLVVVIAPGCAAVMGGISIAGENAGGARPFLFARAAEVRLILGVKVAAHALGAALLAGTAMILGARLGVGVDGWCLPMQTTSARAWMLGVALVPAMFLVGVACSLLLHDALSAAPAAVVAGGFWVAGFVMPPIWLAGSPDAGLDRMASMLAALVAGAALLALFALRWSGLFVIDPLANRAGGATLLVLAAVLGGGWGHAMTGEAAQSRTVLAGSGGVVGDDIVADPRASAVAFVATPESGRARTVIALIDERRIVTLTVLAAGTEVVGWAPSREAFLVTWPDHGQRAVSPTGDITPLPGPQCVFTVDAGPFSARAGKLVRSVGGQDVIAFPAGGSR